MTIPASMWCECVRCGYRWIKRIDGRPKRCPSPTCKEHDWDIPVGKKALGRPPAKKAVAKRKPAK